MSILYTYVRFRDINVYIIYICFFVYNIWIKSDIPRRPFQQGPGGQALQGPDFLMLALQRANTFFWPFFKDDVGPLGPMYGPYKGW